MKWTNIVGAAALLVVVSAIRLQDRFIFKNQGERDAFVKAADVRDEE